MPPSPPTGNLQAGLTVTFGGVSAKVLYQGRSGCCAGLDQIVAQVPPNAVGCAVPIKLISGAAVSTQTSTLAITANGTACGNSGGNGGPMTYSGHEFTFQYSSALKPKEQKLNDFFASDLIGLFDSTDQGVLAVYHRSAPKNAISDQVHLDFVNELTTNLLIESKLSLWSKDFRKVNRPGGVTYQTTLQAFESKFDPKADPLTTYVATFCCETGHFVAFIYGDSPASKGAAEIALNSLSFPGRTVLDLLTAHWFQPGMSLVIEAIGRIWLSDYPPKSLQRIGTFKIQGSNSMNIQWQSDSSHPAELESCSFIVTPTKLDLSCDKNGKSSWQR